MTLDRRTRVLAALTLALVVVVIIQAVTLAGSIEPPADATQASAAPMPASPHQPKIEWKPRQPWAWTPRCLSTPWVTGLIERMLKGATPGPLLYFGTEET